MGDWCLCGVWFATRGASLGRFAAPVGHVPHPALPAPFGGVVRPSGNDGLKWPPDCHLHLGMLGTKSNPETHPGSLTYASWTAWADPPAAWPTTPAN